jgi:hypothetical protein
MNRSNRYVSVRVLRAGALEVVSVRSEDALLPSRVLIVRAMMALTLCWLLVGFVIMAWPSGVAPSMALSQTLAPAFIAPPSKPTLIEVPHMPRAQLVDPAVRSGGRTR